MTRPISQHVFPVTPYEAAWRWQQATAAAVRGGDREALALLQHPPVYTFGRRVRPEHLLVPPDVLNARGAKVIETDRGGDVTFHGLGQLVAYPILDLRRRGLGPTEYVRRLEEVLLRTLSTFDVDAWRSPGRPGVWTGLGKIAAIGVRIEGGVSLHGFALNVDVDLAWFDAIVPCGLPDTNVTSMAEVLGASPGIEAVTKAAVQQFATVFDAPTYAAERTGDPMVTTCSCCCAASTKKERKGIAEGTPLRLPVGRPAAACTSASARRHETYFLDDGQFGDERRFIPAGIMEVVPYAR